MAEIEFATAGGRFELRRPFTSTSSPLRAWTSADRVLVDEVAGSDLGRLLIVGDAWGAVTVALADQRPVSWTDSVVARQGIDANLVANGHEPLGVRAIAGDVLPPGRFDTALVVVPKSFELLTWWVDGLRRVMASPCRVIAAGLSKHLTARTTAILGRLGTATPRRAIGRARLIDVAVDAADAEAVVADAELPPPAAPAFSTDEGVEVWHAPGVFSHGHLDVGTRLLLAVLDAPSLPLAGDLRSVDLRSGDLRSVDVRSGDLRSVDVRSGDLRSVDQGAEAGPVRCVDLACGNGVIAVTLARRWPATRWWATDASDLASAATRATGAANGVGADRLVVETADGLSSHDDASIDIVVSNPPFHEGHAVDTDLTDRLIADAARVLRDGGCGWFVVQRHLRIDHLARRSFARVDAVSKHATHVVLRVAEPRR